MQEHASWRNHFSPHSISIYVAKLYYTKSTLKTIRRSLDRVLLVRSINALISSWCYRISDQDHVCVHALPSSQSNALPSTDFHSVVQRYCQSSRGLTGSSDYALKSIVHDCN
ncbi:MAG: hypothetical protein FRX48_02650 [Lasallia pustulata]|uniref:Uncharacterized protein n=1 Tax=Lasallia pustulata TaxID=136370 RepID=A0A5M8PXD0_9LECA|nr:MAG: hypothetical protein FRX48_02650 [Lasallia pustulata]